MAEAQQKTTSNFLIKIDKIRKKSYANSIFLKPDDVIVALNNQFYTYGEKKFVVESSQKTIPNFLINKNSESTSHEEVIKSFNIVGDFLEKTILKPNNLNYPNSRLLFLDSFK